MSDRNTIIASVRCAFAVMAVAALAGCADGKVAGQLTPAGAIAAPPPAAAHAAAPAAVPPPPKPTTQEAMQQARAECWMKTESDRAARDIDRRVKLVEKCVDDKMTAQPAQ
jgi:hypothetical protein